MNYKVKQVKIAQGIRGETSNILTDAKYHLNFEGNMLHVSPKIKSNYGPFVIFPANIAYMEIDNSQEMLVKEKAEVFDKIVAGLDNAKATAKKK